LICSFNFLIFLAVCLNISTVINIKILTNSNQQTRSYKFTSHIAAFLSVVLITEMVETCIQTYDQNVQLILKSYLPVVYGTPLRGFWLSCLGPPKILILIGFPIFWFMRVTDEGEGYFRNATSYTSHTNYTSTILVDVQN
jgi:hypothetical protein